MLDHSDYYSDHKYCHECEAYVPYLMSLEHSYCAQCGSRVRLFSESDWEAFHAALKERRPKGGGRPRKRPAKGGGDDLKSTG